MQEMMDTKDPLFLRAAFDSGTWQPHRLTALEHVEITLRSGNIQPSLFRPLRSRSPAGVEWAPLAAQVTSLRVDVRLGPRRQPTTGIVAGLGAPTALRSLLVDTPQEISVEALRHHGVSPLAIDRVRASHLTELCTGWTMTPLDMAAFPRLVDVVVSPCTNDHAPVNLRSLVARARLRKLVLGFNRRYVPFINLEELLAGGAGLPGLSELNTSHLSAEWDTQALLTRRPRPSLPRARASCFRRW